jgi:TPR repeat protein
MRDLGTLNAFVKPAPDRGQAERWLLAAADRGDTQAQHLLGVLYLDAKGAGRRPAAAYKWLMLAAERGHLLSALMLRVAAAQFSEEERKEGERLAAEWRPIR